MKPSLFIIMIISITSAISIEDLFVQTLVQLPTFKTQADKIVALKEHLRTVALHEEQILHDGTTKEDILIYQDLLSETIEHMGTNNRKELVDRVYWNLNGAGGMKYNPTYSEMIQEGKMVISLINAVFAGHEMFEISSD